MVGWYPLNSLFLLRSLAFSTPSTNKYSRPRILTMQVCLIINSLPNRCARRLVVVLSSFSVMLRLPIEWQYHTFRVYFRVTPSSPHLNYVLMFYSSCCCRHFLLLLLLLLPLIVLVYPTIVRLFFLIRNAHTREIHIHILSFVLCLQTFIKSYFSEEPDISDISVNLIL